MSRRATKRAALASLKSARHGTLTRFNNNASDDEDEIGAKSNLDNIQFSDPEDVYETMTEQEYREYVERKREREDFVVDDDGLGYHDDGEYDIRGFGGEDNMNIGGKKKRGNGTAALTKEALRKARKNKALDQGKGGESFVVSYILSLLGMC